MVMPPFTGTLRGWRYRLTGTSWKCQREMPALHLKRNAPVDAPVDAVGRRTGKLSCRNKPGISVENGLNVTKWHPPEAKKAKRIQGYIKMNITSRAKKVTTLLNPALVRLHLEYFVMGCTWSTTGFPVQERHGQTETTAVKGHKDD